MPLSSDEIMQMRLNSVEDRTRKNQIDWRKVAARIRSDGEDAQRRLADQRDPETVTAVATLVIVCQVLAAAIEDGLS